MGMPVIYMLVRYLTVTREVVGGEDFAGR